MKKKRFLLTLLLFIGIATLIGLSSNKVSAATPLNVGVIDATNVEEYPWVEAHEDYIKALFIDTYESEGWTEPATTDVRAIDFDKQRHMFIQIYGDETAGLFEGAIIINDISSTKPLIIRDIEVLNNLELLLIPTDEFHKGILLDIVESNGETYYVTDRRNSDGIFKMVEDIPEYHTFRIGVGDGTYPDVMWNEYAKAYKFGVNNGINLGLPTSQVSKHDYTTRDLQSNGNYEDTTSIKTYTKQEFENGLIFQGRLQTRREDGSLSAQHPNFYPAAPILNDMYAEVLAITDNAELNITGAPTSIEYTVDNVRMQNFEYGYVKLIDNQLEFIEDRIVDSQGTEMHRRVGINYPNWQTVLGRGFGWEVLRLNENFRNVFGQMIRDGKTSDPLRAPSAQGTAPASGFWFTFGGGVDRQSLGAANIFIYQSTWYLGAFELAGAFNNPALLVDAQQGIGRPIAEYTEFENTTYQLFEGGLVYIHNSRENRNAGGLEVVFNDTLEVWQGDFLTIEEKIKSLEFDVTFKDADGTVISVEQTTWDTTADALIPDAPTAPATYEFVGWSPDPSTTRIIEDTVFEAVYELQIGNPESGQLDYLNFDVLEQTGKFWYDNETNVIDVTSIPLYSAWRGGQETVADAVALNGLPLFADENNLITTKFHFVLAEGVVTTNDTIGTIPAGTDTLKSFRAEVSVNEHVQNIVSDSFGDTYIYTWNNLDHHLGLPLGATIVETRTKQTDIFATANIDTFKVLVQEFENGFIFQEEYTHAAFPLFGAMYDHWLTLGGLNGEGSLGTPLGVPVEYEGITYQNFTNGYMTYDGTDFEVVLGIVKVDNQGRELDGRAGLTEGRNNVRLGHPDFESEMLRTYLAYQVAFTQVLDHGYVLDEVGNAAGFIHEWSGNGISNSFRNSGSTSNVWGVAGHLNIVLESPHHEAYFLADNILNKYAEDAMRGALGFPTGNFFDLEILVDQVGNVTADGTITLNVRFQNFIDGYVRTYVYNDEVVTEHFFDGEVNDSGELVEEDGITTLQQFTLSETVVDTTDLEAKLEELKTQRDGILNLEGDIADLPQENQYAPKVLLDEIDIEITRIEALLADGTLTQSQAFDETDNLDDLILELTNSTVSGEKVDEEPVDEDPVDEDPTPEDKQGLSTTAVVLIVVASGLALGGAGFGVWKFVIKKG